MASMRASHPLAASRLVASLALALAAAAAGGCSTPSRRPVTTVGLSRVTPRGAYEYLKAMVEAEQPEAEWRCFSPGFKRRLATQVGRNVDIGDYVHARSTVATNSRPEMRLLLESEFVSEEMLSDKVAVVTIQSGRRAARPRFVRMTTWELTLKGEGEPVAEFIPRAADVISISPTGDVQMRVTPSGGTASFLRDIPPEKIQRLVIQDEWYLDDFGGVEEVVVGSLRGAVPPEDRVPPPPAGDGRDQPTPPAPGSPDETPGPGSPDGTPAPGSPDGAQGSGSPDATPSPRR